MNIVHTTCLCGNRDGWPVSRTSDDLVTVQLCKHCGMGYARDYPDAELLAVYYRHIYRDRTKDTPETRWNKQVEHGKDILAWLDGDIRFPIFRMLDVGCATGGTLHPFWNSAFFYEGIDQNEEFIKYGQSRGVDVRLSTLDEVNDEYSLILMRHVLEHVDDPIQTLRKCYDRLMFDGYIYVEVPYFYIERGAPKEQLLSHHKWHFRKETLRAALNAAGFSVVKEDQPNHLRILGKKDGAWSGKVYPIPYTAMQIRSLYLWCLYYNLKTWIKKYTRVFFDR
jgi:SAM-dependent methyltransferase